jgi:hypothetical protein
LKRKLIWIVFWTAILAGFDAASDFFVDVVPTDRAMRWKFRHGLLSTWLAISLDLIFLKFADPSQRKYFAFPFSLTVIGFFGLVAMWAFY